MNLLYFNNLLVKIKAKFSKAELYTIIFFFFFYAILLLGYPINHATGGICDTWLAISIYNSFHQLLLSLFTSEAFTTSLYPASNIFQYGESVVGFSFIFIFFKILGFNDLIAYYLLLVTIFSANAIAVFYLIKYHTQNTFASLIAGLLFSCSNYIFANIDDIAIFCYALPIFSILLLLKFAKTHSKKRLYWSFAIISLQIYFSLYIFAYGMILFLLILLVLFIKKKLVKKINWSNIIICFSISILCLGPYLAFYLYSKNLAGMYTPSLPAWDSVTNDTYLHLRNFFEVLPNNLIYSSNINEYNVMLWFAAPRKSAFVGFLFLIMAVISIIYFYKEYYIWIIVAFCGILLSFAGFTFMGVTIDPPYKYVSDAIPVLKIFRVPLRAYMLTILAFSFFIGIGLDALFKKIKYKWMIIALGLTISIVHLIENVPHPLPLTYIKECNIELAEQLNIKINEDFSAEWLIPDKELVNEIQKTDVNAVILCLPSNYIFAESEAALLTWSREIIYMNHQTYFKRNVINGVNGYYPYSRVQIQKIIDDLPSDNALNDLKSLGVTHLLYYRNFTFFKEEDMSFYLKNNKQIRVLFNDGNFIYAILL